MKKDAITMAKINECQQSLATNLTKSHIKTPLLARGNGNNNISAPKRITKGRAPHKLAM